MIERPLVAADGHRFTLRLAEPAGARASLVFLPALGVPAAKYDGLAQALAAQGLRVAVPEWRGIASSSLRAGRSRDWGYAELLAHDLPAVRAAVDDPRAAWGGHSLGGQFAAMSVALAPAQCAALALVATGVPHARCYAGRARWAISAFACAIPLITRSVGHFPGTRLGFAGREAGGLMRDWARTVRTGRYGDYLGTGPLDAALARLAVPVHGLRFAHDWLVSPASLDALVAKLGPAPRRDVEFDTAALGVAADHFRWLRAPQAPARWLAEGLLSP